MKAELCTFTKNLEEIVNLFNSKNVHFEVIPLPIKDIIYCIGKSNEQALKRYID